MGTIQTTRAKAWRSLLNKTSLDMYGRSYTKIGGEGAARVRRVALRKLR